LEIITTALVVMVVVKCLSKNSMPESMRGLCIGAVYFVATSSTYLYSHAGNNPAKSLALVIVSGKWAWIPFFLTIPFAGALIGITLFMVLDIEKKKKASKFYSEHGWLTRF
jgi:glycerol uptake facilitator-like aquaporin